MRVEFNGMSDILSITDTYKDTKLNNEYDIEKFCPKIIVIACKGHEL